MTNDINLNITSSDVAKLINEVYQTRKFSIFTTNMCSNVAYVLYTTYLKYGIHACLLGIAHLYIARYQIERNDHDFNISKIMDKHMTYPL